MHQLDQTILVAAAPAAVWALVSDINRNPSWQDDCQSVAFLSKQRNGKGTRWRYRNLAGKEFELEITAWYDGLGYEYRYLDGQARGRIRLQEIAEGTTVQWSFSYVTQGRLAGMRNALVMKRQHRRRMDAGLRALQAAVKRRAGDDNDFMSRSLMRDALTYEARLNYQPRHPSLLREANSSTPPTPLAEPPVLEEEDTRPNPIYADLPADSPLARQPVESEAAPSLAEADVSPPRTPEPRAQEPSIWEVFGMERPEEAGTAAAAPTTPTLDAEVAARPAVTIVINAVPESARSGHPGLRKLLRDHVALRQASHQDGQRETQLNPGG